MPSWHRFRDAEPVPGQKKRKNREAEASRRLAARTAPGTGRWVVHFETQDHAEYREYVRRLRAVPEQAGLTRADLEVARLDALCGREVHPTTYRLSVFVPNP
ncbi:hypothetical protein DFR72_10532 [Lentzea flaviverrucosa]|uniref:Uncharacterized protein n=1 Tax=Lentzea flaviverrucosa TaxID=200379 RepID=A0A1H9Q5Y0_9PSEU|nr:hypothetical protein DFR72_10532 [Lentzea flaviverrucosa]SER55976.1 hypothetical protein SAMN05216195_105541 [Lentzea flaviverrucosa]